MKYLHRVFFYLWLVAAIILACLSLDTNPFGLIAKYEIFDLLIFSYTLLFAVVFWSVFYVEVADYWASRAGRNGKLYLGYAKSIQKDLVVSFSVAIVLASIYWFDSAPYEFSGIDVGFAGIPFLVSAIYAVYQMMSIRIAGKAVRKTPLVFWLLLILIYSGFCYLLLMKNSSGEFSTYQAIWFQVTIFFGSIFAYSSAHLQLYFLKNGRFEVSKFKKYFFREVVRSNNQFYEVLEGPIQNLDKRTKVDKAKHAANLRKKRKRSL